MLKYPLRKAKQKQESLPGVHVVPDIAFVCELEGRANCKIRHSEGGAKALVISGILFAPPFRSCGITLRSVVEPRLCRSQSCRACAVARIKLFLKKCPAPRFIRGAWKHQDALPMFRAVLMVRRRSSVECFGAGLCWFVGVKLHVCDDCKLLEDCRAT